MDAVVSDHSSPVAVSKKAKAKPSSSSSASTCPDSSSARHRPHLTSLPALVHGAMSSFLANNDSLRVLEVSLWASRTYGACVNQLVIRNVNRDDPAPTIQSILKRRPALLVLSIIHCCNRMVRELAEPMAERSCDKLQRLELGDLSPYPTRNGGGLSILFDTLGRGVCPNMTYVSLSFDSSGNQADRDNAMKDLGGVLQLRMNKGCQVLKVLELQRHPPYRIFTISALSPVLSSGVCDKLEELRLGSCELKGPASDELKEWLVTTRAPHLHTFIGYQTRADVIEALSSPGVARGLHFLSLWEASPETVMQLSVSIQKGAWQELRELSIAAVDDGGVSNNLVSRLMEAIHVGAPELKSLDLFSWRMGPEGARTVAQSLRDGACPRLEDLSLSYGSIGDVGVIKLVKALVGEAPCNMTLQRLSLNGERIGDRGMEELARAVTQGGALPNLKGLQLGENRFGDRGVVYLAEAMKDGGLSQLTDLDLSWMNIGTSGMLALSQALIDHHACPHLVRLDIRNTYGASNEAKRGLVEGLSASRGRGKMKVQM